MADALEIDPGEYLQNRLSELDAVKDVLSPDVYMLAENTLRDCIALFNTTHRLSREIWSIHAEQHSSNEATQRERHKREIDSVFSIIQEDVQLVRKIMESAKIGTVVS